MLAPLALGSRPDNYPAGKLDPRSSEASGQIIYTNAPQSAGTPAAAILDVPVLSEPE
jgi:hypothetical protein